MLVALGQNSGTPKHVSVCVSELFVLAQKFASVGRPKLRPPSNNKCGQEPRMGKNKYYASSESSLILVAAHQNHHLASSLQLPAVRCNSHGEKKKDYEMRASTRTTFNILSTR